MLRLRRCGIKVVFFLVIQSSSFADTPMYFWCARSRECHALAARLREGMSGMIADGTYDAIFSKYFGRAIERRDLKHRKLFRIINPFLTPKTLLKGNKLWFSLQTYR
jgi:membrane-bound lytic murein transglycosylase MltF